MTTVRLGAVVVWLLVVGGSTVAVAQGPGGGDGGVEPVPAFDAGALDAAPPVAEVVDAGVVGDAVPATVDAGVVDPSVTPVAVDPMAETAKKKKPLPKGFTGIVGVVTDSLSGEGLIEATVKVIAGGKKSALTDVDGEYRLKLPPGTYDLRIFYALYEGRRVQNVEVKAGEVTRLDVRLEAKSTAIKEVVVEAKADKRNESALLMERKKAAVVQDSIGAQEIARTPDSNAGDAVKRVVGVTLVEGRFPYIRGLGGRYVTTLLNGTFLPSPEPDEPSVPLDLFPVALLSNLNVVKTYSPDLPAAFGGGSLTIDTSTFPTKFEFKTKLQFGGDTITTFQSRPGDTLGVVENLGFRDPSRDLPSAIPTDSAISRTRTPGPVREAAGEAFRNQWTPQSLIGLPNMTLGVQAGDSVKFGKESRLGWLIAGQLSRKDQRLVYENTRLAVGQDNQLTTVDNSTIVTGRANGASSLLANVGLQLNRENEISVLGLYLVNAEAQANDAFGFSNTDSTNFTTTRLLFTQRQLFFNQVRGFHRLGFLLDSELEWQLNYSRVNRLEPDIRDTRRDETAAGSTLRFQPNSGERFFFNLGEDSGGGTASITLPYRAWRFKVGGQGQYSVRDFRGRRFRHVLERGVDEGLYTAKSPEEIFSPGLIGPQADPFVTALEETTFTFDRYTAAVLVAGAFAQVELKPTDWFRAMAGLRFEQSTQVVRSGVQMGEVDFATAGPRGVSAEKRFNDFIPTVNLTFSPHSKVNIRAAYAYTLARPSFREIGPFLFFDFIRRANVSGNADLNRTRIHHGDLRVEWFPSDTEVLAATGFVKQFGSGNTDMNCDPALPGCKDGPIERVVTSVSSLPDFGFRNAPGATLLGVELEARTTLGRITPALQPLRIGGNVSLIQSQITLVPGLYTNDRRPLQGQSPYVANANISWEKKEWGTELGLFYNVYGPRITEVGTNGLPDFYEQPFHRLDFAWTQRLGGNFQLKLAAANILNQRIRIAQNERTVFTFLPGVQFNATISWNYERQ
jgi:hypothetical protein